MLAHSVWLAWRNSPNRVSLRERLALGALPRRDSPLWVEAFSVGQVRALAALLESLGERCGPLLITASTPAGYLLACELFGSRHEVRAAPWDLPGAGRRFLSTVQPRAAVFIETEFMPNLVETARARGIPVALLSAGLSEQALRSYPRLWRAKMVAHMLRTYAAVGAQSETDRDRFIALGAPADRVTVTGNLKFDVPLNAQLAERGPALRARWADGRPLWVAGSTYAAEERILLDVQQRLLGAARASGAPPPVLAFAPRRPERFAAVARWLAQQRVPFACSNAASEDATRRPGADIVLVDEMGVLSAWYAAADVAFVGGSLNPVGGHNVLEPAVLGRPVLVGPNTFNFPDAARCLIEAGGAQRVYAAQDFAEILGTWLRDPEARTLAGARAAAAVLANRGAAARSRALLATVVPAQSVS